MATTRWPARRPSWQAATLIPAPWRFTAILLDPPRDILRTAITQRLDAMLDAGVVEEVSNFLALGLDPALPAMRAHGVPEIAAHLRGETTLPAAIARIATATAQYTKRQATWFRHRRMAAAERTHTIKNRISSFAQFSERNHAEILSFIQVQG